MGYSICEIKKPRKSTSYIDRWEIPTSLEIDIEKYAGGTLASQYSKFVGWRGEEVE